MVVSTGERRLNQTPARVLGDHAGVYRLWGLQRLSLTASLVWNRFQASEGTADGGTARRASLRAFEKTQTSSTLSRGRL